MLRNTFTIKQVGLVPKEGTNFDSFTDWRMLFHDVMEHYFEGNLVGESTVAGEIVAMGHLLYYVEVLGLSVRLTGYTPISTSIVRDLVGFFDEESYFSHPIEFKITWLKQPKVVKLDENDLDILGTVDKELRNNLPNAYKYYRHILVELVKLGFSMAKAQGFDLMDIYKIKEEIEDVIKALNYYGFEVLQGCELRVNVRKHRNTFKVAGTLTGDRTVRFSFKDRKIKFPIHRVYTY